MSLDSDVETPSIDHYQPQHVVVGRQHVQLLSKSEHLQQQTGNESIPREDDVIKMASQMTVDAINSAVRVYAAEQSLTGSDQNRKSAGTEEPASSDNIIRSSPPTQTSLATENNHSTGNQSANNGSTEVDAASNGRAQPETETLPPTSSDGREAEALQDIARLQALTRQLRAAVAESRSADGLPVNVDDTETRMLSKDLEQVNQRSTTKDDDDGGEDDGFNTELISHAKQSRSEKKARKALCKLGLKPVSGVAQVTIRRNKNSVFVISRPDVYVNSSCETYIIFGEARIEDPEERAKQEAAKNFVGTSSVSAGRVGKPSADSADDNNEAQMSDAEDIDETGISAPDIDLVMSQAGVSRSHAVRALRDNDNDIVNALMDLTT